MHIIREPRCYDNRAAGEFTVVSASLGSGLIVAMAVRFFQGEPPLEWCSPEVPKMCKKTDFDAKTTEFDRRLLELFEECAPILPVGELQM